MVVVVLAIAASAVATAAPAAAEITSPDPRPGTWVTNGRVNAMVRQGSSLYIGGEFTTVGPQTGHGVFLDPSSGAVLPGSPSINGNVYDAVPDGAGGAYVVGDFSAINGRGRGRGAHVRADGSIDAFDPSTNGLIRQIVQVRADRWAIAGDFTTVQGVAAGRIALIDATGAPRDWIVSANGPVHALTMSPDGTRLLVAGAFSRLGGLPRGNIGSILVATGEVEAWAPQANGVVTALAVSAAGTRVYVGGTFTLMGVLPRKNLAAVDLVTGVTDPAWTVNVDGPVLALAVSPSDILHIGGRFSKIKTVGRSNVGAVDFAGNVVPWSPVATDAVNSITLDGDTAWLTGSFTSVRFVQRMFLARVNLTTGDPANRLDPFASSTSRVAVPLGNGRLFFGGDFTSVGATKRAYLARIDLTTGRLDPTFTPFLNGSVNALELSEDGTTLYVGGRFTNVNGAGRRLAAALLVPSGQLTAFDPDVDGFEVLAMDQRGGRVVLGGQFTKVGRMPMANAARVDADTGAVNALFTPNPNAAVRDVDTLANGNVIIAGDFTTVNVVTARSYLAELGPNGGAQPWQPNPPSFVVDGAVSADGTTYYAGITGPGGAGNAVEAYTRAGDGRRLWRTEGDGDVQAISVSPDGETIYVGGHFFRIFATGTSNVIAFRNRAMAVSAATGALRPWAPPLDFGGSGVWSVLATPDELYIGGDFTAIGPASTQGLAMFTGSP